MSEGVREYKIGKKVGSWGEFEVAGFELRVTSCTGLFKKLYQ